MKSALALNVHVHIPSFEVNNAQSAHQTLREMQQNLRSDIYIRSEGAIKRTCPVACREQQ